MISAARLHGQYTHFRGLKRDWPARLKTPVSVVIGLCLLSFALQVNILLFTDIQILATTWIQDDSFYYWQAAWMFKDVGFFTFDGLNSTYGFQPLWTLILTALAYPSPDKVSFLRA